MEYRNGKNMAIDLQKISGLPISFDEKKIDLEFQGNFPFIKKSERTLDELRPYLKNPYPEIYEVLLGRAYFLIQSESIVYLAEAGPGEKFIIPPSFGHNTINVFNEPLLMANFVSEKAEYDYK